MFEAENIRDWRKHDVVDLDGDKIGELEAVYVDTVSDEPAFASVVVGFPGRHRLTFVPLHGAKVAPGFVRVTCPKKLAKHAPSIDVDGELRAEDEPKLFEHYGLEYGTAPGGARKLARR